MFYECNLPLQPPTHLDASIVEQFVAVMERVTKRFQKLNEALEMSGVSGEVFSDVMSPIFKSAPDEFDDMPVEMMAELAMYLGNGKELPKRLEWPNADVVVDADFLATKEWEMIRHLGIGGSDSSVVLNQSHFKNRIGLYYDKRGVQKLEAEPHDTGNPVFKRGHILEDEVIQNFLDRTGAVRIHEPRMFRSKTHPHCIADIDAIVKFPNGDLAVFEAKSTKAANRISGWGGNRIPETYLPQCRHYAAVLNDDKITCTHIGCLFVIDYMDQDQYLGCDFDPAEFESRIVERDKEEEKYILDSDEEFWAQYIDAGQAPEPTGREGELADVMTYQTGRPAVPDKNVPVDSTELPFAPFEDMIEEYFAVKAKKDALKASEETIATDMERIKTKLISAMGGAHHGIIHVDDKRVIEIKHSGMARTSIDSKKLQAEFPDAYSACATKKVLESTRFSVTERVNNKRIR